MRVRILESFVESHQAYSTGTELEVSDQYGLDLLKRGLCERLESGPETAVMPNRGERAVRTARPVR